MVPIEMLLLGIGFRLGGYCLGYGSDGEAIAFDRVAIRMLLILIGFQFEDYYL